MSNEEMMIGDPRGELEGDSRWKGYKVAVFGAASDDNQMAIRNSRAVGGMLAKQGYDATNGGYAVGGMGAMAEGYIGACREAGMSDDTIKEHLKGLTTPEITGRPVISPANIREMSSRDDRLHALVGENDAYIATEGGSGTIQEIMTAVRSEMSRRKEGEDFSKPIIIIDNEHMALKTLEQTDQEELSDIPADLVYILSGKTVAPIQEGESLNNPAVVPDSLEDNGQMEQKLELVLELYYLLKSKDPAQSERVDEIKRQLFDSKSSIQVLTLKDYFEATRPGYSTK